MNFGAPLMLLTLLAVPLAFGIYWLAERRRMRQDAGAGPRRGDLAVRDQHRPVVQDADCAFLAARPRAFGAGHREHLGCVQDQSRHEFILRNRPLARRDLLSYTHEVIAPAPLNSEK